MAGGNAAGVWACSLTIMLLAAVVGKWKPSPRVQRIQVQRIISHVVVYLYKSCILGQLHVVQEPLGVTNSA